MLLPTVVSGLKVRYAFTKETFSLSLRFCRREYKKAYHDDPLLLQKQWPWVFTFTLCFI